MSSTMHPPLSLSLRHLRIADSTLFQPRISAVATVAESQVEHFAEAYGLTFPGLHLVTSMASYLYPEANLKRSTIIGNMMLMLFYIDDVFGDLPSSQGLAGYETPPEILASIDACCQAFTGSYEDHSDNLVRAFITIREQMQELSPSVWFDRFAESIVNHLISSILPGRYGWHGDGTVTVEDYIRVREYISGMYPTVDFVEFAQGQYLPESAIADTSILKLRQHVVRIGCLTNDLFSYQKEVVDGGLVLNLLHVLQESNGQSLAEAAHTAIELINEETDAFFSEAEVVSQKFDDSLRTSIERYVEGLTYQLSATWYWQISTNRYRSPQSPFIELRAP